MAGNILTNPGMDDSPTDLVGWTPYGRTGQEGWYSYALATPPDVSFSAPNSFKTYAGWNGDPNFNGVYQDNACFPTSTFTATGMIYTRVDDALVGVPGAGNTAWLEVTFRDASEAVLTQYRSAIYDETWGADFWDPLPVDVQVDPVTGDEIATGVTSLVAPAGTTTVRYQVVLRQEGNTGGGAVWVDDMVLDQTSGPVAPVISNLTPGSMLLVDPAGGIQFDVTAGGTSPTPIDNSGIQMTLNGTDVSGDLVITGSSTSKQVTYSGLVANTVYSAAITVTDTLGLSANATSNFDTYQPVLLWEAEDFNFDGGSFIDSPAPNAYVNKVGTQGIDENDVIGNGDHIYRPADMIATPASGDTPRQAFLTAGATDYKVGWYDAGEWVNFTRTFPAGSYNVIARLSGGGGAATLNMSRVTSDPTQPSQLTEAIGQFSFDADGWNSYEYVQLTDTFGNPLAIDLEGVTTVRMTSNAGADMTFFMLVPAVASPPAITNVSPDGLEPFQQTNVFSFDATSDNATIPDERILLSLNGVDVTADLLITGSGGSKSVTYDALVPNALYTAVIGVTDSNDENASTTIEFDTFAQTNFMVEAEDYDYGGGLFIDNPVPTPTPAANSYREQLGTADIDFGDIGNNGNKDYRPLDAMATPVAQDFLRQKFIDATTLHGVDVFDYKVGWFDGGEWVNYTRTWPSGTFQVYGRLAGNPGVGFALHLERVTGGEGTPTQTTERLGTFSGTGGGWETYEWVLLTDETSGTPVTVQLNGEETLRLVTTGNNDPNFIMLVPGTAAPPELELSVRTDATDVHLDFQTENGVTYEILYKDSLEDAQWNSLTTRVGDGNVMTVSETIPGSERYYVLSIP